MMSEKIVIARHRHICELCDQPIRPGERCRLIRDDDLAQLKPPKERHVTLAPGSRLIREWHGKVHEVVVLKPRMYDYDGQKFKSLTAVAEHITGQHQSGLLFFGVSK